MMQPTYDDANLLLRLYEIRREDKMRQARQWFLFDPLLGTGSRSGSATSPETSTTTTSAWWQLLGYGLRPGEAGVLNRELFYSTNGGTSGRLEQDQALGGGGAPRTPPSLHAITASRKSLRTPCSGAHARSKNPEDVTGGGTSGGHGRTLPLSDH